MTNQHETVEEGKNTIVLVDVDENGNRADLAKEAARALNNRNLSGKVPANRPRALDEQSDRKMAASHALVREADDAKFVGLKMVVKLDDHGLGKESKKNGIAAMHHFRMERPLKERFVCCPVPCFCEYCGDRLDKPTVEERYSEPRKGCPL